MYRGTKGLDPVFGRRLFTEMLMPSGGRVPKNAGEQKVLSARMNCQNAKVNVKYLTCDDAQQTFPANRLTKLPSRALESQSQCR